MQSKMVDYAIYLRSNLLIEHIRGLIQELPQHSRFLNQTMQPPFVMNLLLLISIRKAHSHMIPQMSRMLSGRVQGYVDSGSYYNETEDKKNEYPLCRC